MGKLVLIVLTLVHVAAVLYYLWRRKKNLLAPMIHGDAALPTGTMASRDGAGQRVLAAVVVLAAAAFAGWIGSLGTP